MALGGAGAASGAMKGSMSEMMPMMIGMAQMQMQITMLESVLNLQRSLAAGVKNVSTTPQ